MVVTCRLILLLLFYNRYAFQELLVMHNEVLVNKPTNLEGIAFLSPPIEPPVNI